MPTSRKICRIRLASPFRLSTVARSHGWYELPPFRFDGAKVELATTIEVGVRTFDVTITQPSPTDLSIAIVADRGGRSFDAAPIVRAVERILDLAADLTDFWRMTSRDPKLAWVKRHAAGRMLRAATPFEDLMKILLTTNCSWGLTRAMCTSMVGVLGRIGPSGVRAFPAAATVAAEKESFFRDVVKTGYRARAVRELALRAAAGEFDGLLDEIGRGRLDAVRKSLTSIRGFGPYATGLALRLLGVRSEMALDSWCRERIRQLWGRKKAPSDRAIERAFREYGDDRGLALWLTLTADWHEAVED
jgi:3-methyladenine DNA glycosylase/8-oxoguanine DNA glycosylase